MKKCTHKFYLSSTTNQIAMYINKFLSKPILVFIITLIFINCAMAQEKKVATTSPELYNEIARMDSIMFDAFNHQNLDKFKPLFTTDLEWYQDNGGMIPYKTVFENFDNTFKKPYKLTRELVPGSLEVHPIKDYGAIEIGTHRFRHVENGKEEVGTFKFLMIWQNKDGQWKISRVVSYDH
jgi:Domain of unknown function (DUF4440)